MCHGLSDSNDALAELAKQKVTPFLEKYNPRQFTPLRSEVGTPSGSRPRNGSYCYRHQPDSACRRQADEVSMRQSFSGRIGTTTGSRNMPDFFTASIFQGVLRNPTTVNQLLKFSESRLCAENVEFLSKVDAYRTTLNELASQMATIDKTFICPSSEMKYHQLYL